MCGICGFVNLDGSSASRSIVEKMNEALLHRGPDDGGVLINDSVALAMRRLSILDIEGGHQPLSNEDGLVWIVFNGEIYNSPQLRTSLQELGHQFSTLGDTETIVHQYEESGRLCPSSLRGMFSFAIFDKRDESCLPKLFLARDPLGIKPLYYYHDEKLFAFSSELNSLIQHPAIVRDIEPKALRQYLATGIVAAPLTMFLNIRQLMPGESLLFENNNLNIEEYWHPPKVNEHNPGTDEAVSQIRYLLEQSVNEHMLSDVPVGAFLSGGIDSSAIVALMSQASKNPVPTFSVRFEESGYDESSYSRLVADMYKTDHHEFIVPNKGFDVELIQKMIKHHGQPTADSSALPTYIISSLARKHVKVVLSGDGGDECFAGYHHYGWGQQIEKLYLLPTPLRKMITGILRKAPVIPGLSQSEQLRKILNAFDASLAGKQFIPLEVLRINSEQDIDKLLKEECIIECRDDDLYQFLIENKEIDPISAAQRFSFRYFMPDAYLPKVDRMSMAASLEVRVPFLDLRLVEYSLSLPGRLHWSKGVGKQLLRRAVSDLLPEEIFTHRKQGFSIPLHRWTTDEYFDLAEDILNEQAVSQRGLLDPKEVRLLLNRCRGEGKHLRALESDYRLSHRLFMLVVLEIWCRMYLDKKSS